MVPNSWNYFFIVHRSSTTSKDLYIAVFKEVLQSTLKFWSQKCNCKNMLEKEKTSANVNKSGETSFLLLDFLLFPPFDSSAHGVKWPFLGVWPEVSIFGSNSKRKILSFLVVIIIISLRNGVVTFPTVIVNCTCTCFPDSTQCANCTYILLSLKLRH